MKQAFTNCLRISSVLYLYVTFWFKAFKTYTQVSYSLTGQQTPHHHPRPRWIILSSHPSIWKASHPRAKWSPFPSKLLVGGNALILQSQKLPIILAPQHQRGPKKYHFFKTKFYDFFHSSQLKEVGKSILSNITIPKNAPESSIWIHNEKYTRL